MMMVDNILGNIKIIDMEKECLVLLIEMFIWDHGNKINFMEMVYINMQMDRNIKANLQMVKNQEKVYIIIKVEQDIKVNGKKIEKMDLVDFFTQIIKDTKEIG